MKEIDRFSRELSRIIDGSAEELYKAIKAYGNLLVVQVVLDIVTGKFSVLVNLFFIGLTGWGFFKDIEGIDRAKTFVRFILAVIAFLIDLWLTFFI